ncbi:MAG TPA: nuclease [Blastocatellia bacterium]|nr:nuclease [Blastocatellia bacterium]
MLSPTAIADFLACQHLTALDRAEAAEQIKRPYFADPGLDLLIRLGQAHEQAYLNKLTEQGLAIVEIPTDGSRRDAARRTIEAIRGGAEVIYQATFLDDPGYGQWYGRADFLIRVDKPSELGAFSYEVVETKLAKSTKARAIIQLCFYSDLLSRIQGVVPDYMHVVLGGGAKPEKFFVQRYLAFFRKIQSDFVAAELAQRKTYPEPVEHCHICDWSTVCDAQWRQDDHLSLVANIARNQRQALIAYGTETVAGLARLSVPPEPKIEGIKDQAFANIHQQARLQVQGREERRNIYELLVPPEPEKGLCSLPTPSPGDIFLDFEGDQFTFEGGLEYLFGVLTIANDNGELVYEPIWAMKPQEEKRAFERFIKAVLERRRLYPDMHIYHYGAYEETAIKRMAGQHSTCVDEVDELLRGEVLVDMFRAVRQGLRASVESYSLKKLEPVYEYTRDVNLPDANLALWTFQTVLAFGHGEENLDDIKSAIEGYNRDDCVSALRLRDWLERLRTELEHQVGAPLARPEPKDDELSENLTEYLQRVRAVEERLTAGLPEEKDTWTESQKATGLLADLLEWHRREDKSKYWEYFTRCDYSDEEFITDRATLGGLVYTGEVEPVKKSKVHRYRFPFQDTTIERALGLRDPKTKKPTGDLHAIEYEALTIDLKRGPSLADAPHPTALVPYDIINAKAMRESLLQLGGWVADHGIEGDGIYAAARDLLLLRAPRLKHGGLPDFEHLPSLEAAKQIALVLDRTVLPIQGPPGSGKTFTGAHMIVELIKKGKKVGVTAVSHKVISNLLKWTCKAAAEQRLKLKILQRCDGDDACGHDFVKIAKNNAVVDHALANNEAQIVAGTVWLWSRPELAGSVDVLFVDEAGQMSLANVLAASPATNSIVLLGDPQQLDQPQRGVHPEGAEASALSHLLNGHKTITPDRGLFLAESWRLHPDICAFTSDVFYESRLTSRPENANQRLDVAGPIAGTGLRIVPVEHEANQSDSPEEVEKVAELVELLLRDNARWVDKESKVRRITLNDILIVAPYNAQVSLLLRSLPRGSRVGTVDKFQGQEAPVVIYSMATSTPQDAPRGMEFLYSGNRLNVATSRAQCVTILVASPALFDVQCKTPRQMELANAFCRYLEMAGVI